MKLYTVIPVVGVTLVQAFPGAAPQPATEVRAAADPRFTQWRAPGPNDVRSPCPGLNSLANHGFLNRNGKGNTIPQLIAGGKAGLNMGADFMGGIGLAGLAASPFPLLGSFDLNDLDKHNFPIEHDGSLSREDAFFGNDYSFNQTDFNMLLSHFQGGKTSIKTASEGKYARVQDSRRRNPTMVYGAREFVLSYGETALYLQTMSDPFSGVANVNYIKSLFEKEKLPYELGWRPSTQEITLLTLGNMVFELFGAGPEPAPEGLKVTADTYKNAFEVVNGVLPILGNLTTL
ncbi:hypothetical protein FH972_023503 [Carpinus fangiana]|uniref:Heme haloperoxidase family profile domain-containing protein n=1 Tax=Carpinus fangiana TaxID=176857 RepID=A0A5N6KVR0_9ROSI|nr:hypothetical protein FH972_023503 [Carpinus fangiana]